MHDAREGLADHQTPRTVAATRPLAAATANMNAARVAACRRKAVAMNGDAYIPLSTFVCTIT